MGETRNFGCLARTVKLGFKTGMLNCEGVINCTVVTITEILCKPACKPHDKQLSKAFLFG